MPSGIYTRKKIGKNINCLVCKKIFYIKPYKEGKAKYCSRKCLTFSKLSKPTWNKDKLNPHKGSPRSVETREKISKTLLKNPFRGGENHYKWIKDRSLLRLDRNKMYDTQYKYWSVSIKKRDNWKCKINNSDCKGRLESHHILNWRDHPELRYEINNGITLCHAHHPRKRSEEAELSPYFQSLVAEMK